MAGDALMVKARRNRAWPPGVALAALIATVVLAGCGVGNQPPPTTGQPSTSTSSTTTSTVPGSSADGSTIDHLPTVPSPSRPPSSPDLSSATAQKDYLRSVFADIQSMWKGEFTSAGETYSPARLVIFTSSVSTACGPGSSDSGPFYCSGDHTVYLDVSFFRTLEARFGLSGDFAEAYVVAHEVGHHVQTILGISGRVGAAREANPSESNALSVRLELQADCLAGVWAHSVYQRDLLQPGDIDAALHAAQVVGDDFLAHAHGATSLEPDSWTHGSSAQRQHWFTTGYKDGRPDACNTFAGV